MRQCNGSGVERIFHQIRPFWQALTGIDDQSPVSCSYNVCVRALKGELDTKLLAEE
jgi:hypothetical protein